MSRALDPRSVLIGVILALGCVSGAASNSTAKPPNIVLVLVDDLGWMDLSCQGSTYYRTPHVDKLAAQGMRFTDAYAACAVCSPTRASVMTGRYPARVGVTDWIRAKFQRGKIGTPKQNPTEYVGGANRKLLCPPNPYWMEHEEVTLAEALKPAGYVTCHIGKWHLGDEAWYPPHQGFDFNFGGCDLGQPPSYFDPYFNKRYQMPTLKPRKKGEYLSDREADEAVGFIRKHKDRPFFLYLAHYAVHTPIQAKEDVAAKYRRSEKAEVNAKYAAMVESVDDAMGRVMETLEELKLAERTLVIFTSDNGGLDNGGKPTDNAPLRSGKGYAYEGGIRVPLIVRWPGVVPAGSISHEPVSSVDYFPTVLEAVGRSAPHGRPIDGVSLVDHLKSGGKRSLERDALIWHFPHYRHSPGPYSIIRKGPWKLIRFWEGPVFELFNLKNDLSEKTDLASKMPDKVRELDQELMARLKSMEAKLPKPNPAYKPVRKK